MDLTLFTHHIHARVSFYKIYNMHIYMLNCKRNTLYIYKIRSICARQCTHTHKKLCASHCGPNHKDLPISILTHSIVIAGRDIWLKGTLRWDF